REKGGNLLLDAPYQLLIDRDADQQGCHTFRYRVLLMDRHPIERPNEIPGRCIAMPSLKILLDDELVVSDQEHAVNVFVRLVEDPIKQRFEHLDINILTAHMGGVPPVIGRFRHRVLIRLDMTTTTSTSYVPSLLPHTHHY